MKNMQIIYLIFLKWGLINFLYGSFFFLVLPYQILAKNARFEQIWRSRKGKNEAAQDKALHEMCHLYDVVRVDVEETSSQVQE